jgi:hypothetical protein
MENLSLTQLVKILSVYMVNQRLTDGLDAMVKGKVVSLILTEHYVMKAYRGNGGIALLIL